MKNKIFKLFVILLISLISSGGVFAGDTYCPIKNWNPALKKYLRDVENHVQELVQKIISDPELNPQIKEKFSKSQEVKKKKVESPWLDNFIFNSASPVVDEWVNTFDKTKNFLTGEWKKIIDVSKEVIRVSPSWDSYVLSVWFWIWAIYYDYSLPIVIKNDFEQVRWLSERLRDYSDNLIEAWIDINPKFEKSYVLGFPWLIELNDRLQYAIMWAVAKWFSNEEKVIKESNKAITWLRNYITKYHINFDTSFLEQYTSIIKNEQCRQDTGPIDEIIEMWEGGFDWIFDEWEEAYDLLMWTTWWWNDSQQRKARQREKEILWEAYWDNEGADQDVDIFFDSLKNGTSFKRLNPISNTTKQEFENFKKYLEDLWAEFEKTKDKIENPLKRDEVNIKDLYTKANKKFETINTTITVRNLYEELRYITPATNKQRQDLRNNILKNHKTLEEAINFLERWGKLAEKVCKSQWVGLWKCNSKDYTTK